MIRNMVLGKARTGLDEQQQADLDAALAGIGSLRLPGQLSMQVGRDTGLRDGGWTFAITNVWIDEQAYRDYDVEAEHNRYRAVLGALCTDIARVQFVVSEPGTSG